MADISKIKLPDGTKCDLKDANGRKEAYLEWGGKNQKSSFSPIDAAMINSLGANRLELPTVAGIVIEYSRDGGETWIDYEASDTDKRALFSSIGTSIYIGKLTSADVTAGNLSTDWMVRATLLAYEATIYTVLNKFAFFIADQTAQSYVSIHAQRKADENTDIWVTFADEVPMAGNTGWNIVNTSGITTYGNTTSQYEKLRFTFGTRTVGDNNNKGLTIKKILGFGGVGWRIPNNLAATGHIYSYDTLLNATFPAKVTATEFIGNVRGYINGAYFNNINNSGQNANNIASNGFSYYTSNGPSTALGASTNDGAIYSQYYSNSWQAQIAQDYRNGRLFVRGKNNGTWQDWKRILQFDELSTSTSSTSTTTAATSSAVKTAYDLANTANGTANTALSGVEGTLIYDHTYSIANGVATFTAHVYCQGEEVTSDYADSCFTWGYRLDSAISSGTPSVVSLGTGKTKTVNISTLGYGGHVIGQFTPPE